MPWADKYYQCGQPGHIARNCTQGPTTASSVGSVGGGRGTIKSAWQGQATTLESCAQAQVYAMTQKDGQVTSNVVTSMLLPGHIARNCTQGPTTASSVGSVIGGSKGGDYIALIGVITLP